MPYPRAWIVLASIVALVSGCGASASTQGTLAPSTTRPAAATTTRPAATTTTRPTAATTVALPTTTLGVPPSPQPGDEEASQDLIAAWAEGNKTAALAVATPSAVATLFAVPYPTGNAVFRGCSVSFPPLVCTFGAPGGGDPNAAIIEVSVMQTAGGWYDSAVDIET